MEAEKRLSKARKSGELGDIKSPGVISTDFVTESYSRIHIPKLLHEATTKQWQEIKTQQSNVILQDLILKLRFLREELLSASKMRCMEDEQLKFVQDAIEALSFLEPKPPQIRKQTILKFLSYILDSEVSNKVLVDINPSFDDKPLITVGRPGVSGSSTKQMRHVTPFAFIKEVIKEKIIGCGGRVTQLFSDLKETLSMFVEYDKGICLPADQYMRFIEEVNDGNSVDAFMLRTRKVRRDEEILTSYYLINEKTAANFSPEIDDYVTKEDYELYPKQKEKFIRYVLDTLESNMHDDNTFHIASEVLARFILTLYNTSTYTTFPDEGNTLNYEIRLYNSDKDAANPKNKPFKVKSPREIKEIWDSSEYDIQDRIRIVNNEGSVVKKVVDALRKINNIVQSMQNGLSKEFLDIQIEEFNNTSFFGKISIDTSSISEYVAELLFEVFDFKQLENHVFIPNIDGDVEVYPSANGVRKARYSIMDGAKFRASEVNAAKGYNQSVIFRGDTTEENANLLLELMQKHLKICFGMCEDFKFYDNLSAKITEKFLNLVKLNHQLSEDNLTIICNGLLPPVDIEYDEILEEAELSDGYSSPDQVSAVIAGEAEVAIDALMYI